MDGEIRSARGARGAKAPLAAADLLIEIVRPLTDDDLPKLTSPDVIGSAPVPLATLRASHHQAAQLIAQGRPDTEVALLTGYSPSRLSILKSDPSFQQLLASYGEIRHAIFVDTLERMKTLGLSTLDEIQDRLESAPERWSNRELMEMADLMLVKPRAAGGGSAAVTGALGGGQGTSSLGVAIQVQFVKSETAPLVIEGKVENGKTPSP